MTIGEVRDRIVARLHEIEEILDGLGDDESYNTAAHRMRLVGQIVHPEQYGRGKP